MRSVALAVCVCTVLALPCLAQGPAPQQRAIWVSYREILTPEAVARTVERCAAARFNALYVLVWYNGGTAAYRSALCPLMKGVPEGHDPLGALIAAAKPLGMDVHAWFVCGSYGWGDPAGGVFATHPDWELQQGRKQWPTWYDLGKPEVRAFERDVMLECLKNYDVAGIHFDYIRYDGQGMCLCDYCQHEVETRYGIPALKAGGSFPFSATVSANPLDKPTTAHVLASFDDGVPAITLNTLGQGEAALLNWQATRTGHPALLAFVRWLLERFGAKAGARVYQLRNSGTTARYGLNSQEESAQWLRSLELKPQAITEAQLDQVPVGSFVVLHAQYALSPATAAWLEQFVTAGGHVLFVDGPVFALKEPALQRVLGLSGTARYFTGLRAINPAPGQDLIPAGPPLDMDVERRRAAAWAKFRTASVIDLVRQVYQGAKTLKPRAWVSAAVFYNKAAADGVCQDWYGWLREGLIDYVLPMAYTMKNDDLEAALQEYRAFDPPLARIIPGLSIYQNRDGKEASRDVALVQSQQDLCAKYGARGICYFALNHLSPELQAAFAAAPAAAAPIYYPEKP